jgi:mandelamide amidase
LPGGANFVDEATYGAARDRHLPALRSLYRDYFDRMRVSAIIFPATLVAAPKIGEDSRVEVRGRSMRFDVAVARNIAPGSTAGLPGLVLPAGLTRDALPVGIEIDGPAGADRALLALGVAVERALGPMPAPPEFAPQRKSASS